jgi:CubicO group peptidase (beta-lactamase class C family)
MKKIIVVFLLIFPPLFSPEKIFAKEDTTPSGIAIKDLESFVDNYVDDYIAKTTAGASIVIVKNNEIVFSKGYGYSDIKNHIPINSKTSVFEWGSISKLFVWVSVMQLVEQGEIGLNEDIKNYLPDGFLTKLKYDEPITMLNLMNHDAGFEDYVFDLGYASEKQVKSLEEGLRIAEPKQIYRPGEVVAYSNYSTSLAAYIIEQITGQEFYQYVSNNIFSKLDIQESTAYLPMEKNQKTLQNKVNGYELLVPSRFKLSTPFYMSLYPSGGINGTAENLAKFAMAFMPEENKKSILFKNENTLKQMLSQSYSANENVVGIAHGFWEYDGKSKGLTHAGNTTSFSSNFHIVPQENFAVLVLTNQAGELDISYGLVKELVGDNKHIIKDNLPDSKKLEGTYITARRMDSGFLNAYYYLTPFKVSSVNTNKIEVSIAGMTANYIQTSPYVYKMTEGNNVFIPNNVLYFHVENGTVKQISTSISDYLPLDKSLPLLVINSILIIICVVYFLIPRLF